MSQNTIDLFCWIPLASMIHAAYQAMVSLIAARKNHSEIDGMANANALCSCGFTILSKLVPVILNSLAFRFNLMLQFLSCRKLKAVSRSKDLLCVIQHRIFDYRLILL